MEPSIADLWLVLCALCVLAAIHLARAAQADIVRLQALVNSLAARVAAQSDLLSRRAERPEGGPPACPGGKAVSG